jgi:hypothetical protein
MNFEMFSKGIRQSFPACVIFTTLYHNGILIYNSDPYDSFQEIRRVLNINDANA